LDFSPLFSKHLGVISLFLLSLFVTSLRQSEAFALSRARSQLTGKLSRFLFSVLAFFPAAILALISHTVELYTSRLALLRLCLFLMPVLSELTPAPYSGSLQQAILSWGSEHRRTGEVEILSNQFPCCLAEDKLHRI
jgi:hypothetical protein